MKNLILFILIILSEKSFADLKRSQKVVDTQSQAKKSNSKMVSQAVSIKSSSTITTSEIEKINNDTNKKNAQMVESFLSTRNLGISDNTSSFDILTGSTLKGTILNSVVSSNLESPIVVSIQDNNFNISSSSKLICSGFTKGKRIAVICSKLITLDEEFEINATLLNQDGTFGLTGEVYTGKEELIMGAIVGGGIAGALDVSRDRITTTTGELTTNTYRNKLLSGAMGGVEQAVEMMNEESKTKETKVVVQAGREVLIYFNQRFKI